MCHLLLKPGFKPRIKKKVPDNRPWLQYFLFGKNLECFERKPLLGHSPPPLKISTKRTRKFYPYLKRESSCGGKFRRTNLWLLKNILCGCCCSSTSSSSSSFNSSVNMPMSSSSPPLPSSPSHGVNMSPVSAPPTLSSPGELYYSYDVLLI